MRLRELLADGRRVQLDGGLSTALEELGADLDDPLWTARVLRDQPELRARRAPRVRRGGRGDRDQRQLPGAGRAAGRERADRARGGRARRGLASRPYGASLAGGQEYTGDYEMPDGLARAPRRGSCSRPSPTSSRSRPSRAPTRPRRSSRCVDDLDCWVTFTCRDGERTGHGERIEDAVRGGRCSPQVAAVGVNCTAPEYVDELLDRIRTVTDLPLVAYPNAGPRLRRRRPRRGAAPRTPWSGDAAIVGGCCGDRP